jgi:general secretion pathway protein K
MNKTTGKGLTSHSPLLTPYAPHGPNESGMALVLTLMIVALITAMVVEFAYGVYVNTNALHNWQTSQELSVAARSATKLAARLIAERGREYHAGGVFEMSQQVPFGDLDATITLRIEDENAKFNLNALGHTGFYRGPDQDKDVHVRFARLLKALELKPEIADRIADWIDADSEPRAGDSENGAKNADLDSIDELLLIPGIDGETYAKLAPYVTIYGDTKININSAAVPVLMSLSESITSDLAGRVVKYRESAPFTSDADLLKVAGFEKGVGTSQFGYISERGGAFHIIATAEANGVRRIVESVLDGAAVRYWKEM